MSETGQARRANGTYQVVYKGECTVAEYCHDTFIDSVFWTIIGCIHSYHDEDFDYIGQRIDLNTIKGKRPSGIYNVQCGTDWMLAVYSEKDRYWQVSGCTSVYHDSDFTSIGGVVVTEFEWETDV